MPTLTKNGVKFKIEQADLDALIASLGDPRAPVLVRGCRRCKVICSDARSQLIPDMRCSCCKVYGHKSAGGNRTYYKYDPLEPETKSNQPGHVTVATLEDLSRKAVNVA